MSNSEPCKTPVEDLLRKMPEDLVIQYDRDGIYYNCPIGCLAHEAVSLIASLHADLARATAQGMERALEIARYSAIEVDGISKCKMVSLQTLREAIRSEASRLEGKA